MDINDIKSTLEKLDPLKINDSAQINETYDKMKEELTRAGFLDVPTNVPESTVVHREGGLPTGAKLTQEEVARMLKPNPSIDEPVSPDAATVKTTSTKRSAEMHDSFVSMVSPHFSSGLSHAQSMALANVVKEKLTEEKEDTSDVPLYEKFDDTLTKLFEEIENSDTLSDGQKSALLMKVHMTSGNILKSKYEVNV